MDFWFLNDRLYHGNNNQRNDNAKNFLINLMTTIYFTNHQKRQLVDFLKK